jgi:ABC-type bacteriocin/lantibiotic exporter with double-glycine peptidase domain
MNKKQISLIFQILGLIFLVIGLSTDNTNFTWVSIVFILLALILGGRWLRPRRKR